MFKSILSLIFIGSAIGIFILYVKPTYDTTQVNRSQVARFDEALEKTREIQELKSSLLARYNLFTNENLDRLQKLLPDHVDNVRLVLDLDGMASRYGIEIKDVEIQSSDSGGNKSNDINAEDEAVILNGGSSRNLPYESLELGFKVESTYDEFLLLLRDLESSLRVVDLVDLKVETGATSSISGESTNVSGEPNYTFTISLRTYWLK